jgi:hypothetical protein
MYSTEAGPTATRGPDDSLAGTMKNFQESRQPARFAARMLPYDC